MPKARPKSRVSARLSDRPASAGAFHEGAGAAGGCQLSLLAEFQSALDPQSLNQLSDMVVSLIGALGMGADYSAFVSIR